MSRCNPPTASRAGTVDDPVAVGAGGEEMLERRRLGEIEEGAVVASLAVDPRHVVDGVK